jgi:hypothetical protein
LLNGLLMSSAAISSSTARTTTAALSAAHAQIAQGAFNGFERSSSVLNGSTTTCSAVANVGTRLLGLGLLGLGLLS